MTNDRLFWRQRLLARREEIDALGTVNRDGTVELDQSKVGRLSRMDALQGQAMQAAVAKRRAQERKRIDQALEALERGEFGYCAACGEEIARKRLEVNPLVSLCIACAR